MKMFNNIIALTPNQCTIGTPIFGSLSWAITISSDTSPSHTAAAGQPTRPTHLLERQSRGIANITAVPLEEGVRLITNNEDNVGGNLPSLLVALLLERDPRARFPARLHRYAHVLVLALRRPVRLQHPLRDLHLLHAALVDLVQRHVHVVLDRRVLRLLLLQRRVYVKRM